LRWLEVLTHPYLVLFILAWTGLALALYLIALVADGVVSYTQFGMKVM